MTAQVHENLILEGEETTMACVPPLPENDRRIIELPKNKIIDNTDNDSIFSTACWRNYIGNWEIKNNKLYLLSISGKYKVISKIPVFADWAHTTLRIPRGKRLKYIHSAFCSIYEQDLYLKVEKGIIVRKKRIDNRDTK